MWDMILYIIGAAVFARFTDYALNGAEAKGLAPILYIIGAIAWPLVAVVSIGRFVYGVTINLFYWLFNSKI